MNGRAHVGANPLLGWGGCAANLVSSSASSMLLGCHRIGLGRS